MGARWTNTSAPSTWAIVRGTWAGAEKKLPASRTRSWRRKSTSGEKVWKCERTRNTPLGHGNPSSEPVHTAREARRWGRHEAAHAKQSPLLAQAPTRQSHGLADL